MLRGERIESIEVSFIESLDSVAPKEDMKTMHFVGDKVDADRDHYGEYIPITANTASYRTLRRLSKSSSGNLRLNLGRRKIIIRRHISLEAFRKSVFIYIRQPVSNKITPL
jgi:hypothetical protein